MCSGLYKGDRFLPSGRSPFFSVLKRSIFKATIFLPVFVGAAELPLADCVGNIWILGEVARFVESGKAPFIAPKTAVMAASSFDPSLADSGFYVLVGKAIKLLVKSID